MAVVTSSFSGIAFALSLGAATLTVPGFTGLQQTQPISRQQSALYSHILYKTNFAINELRPVEPLDNRDEIAIINDLVRSLTKESMPLSEQQHAILTDNLFDFL